MSTSYIAKGRPSLTSLLFAMETKNDREINGTAESKKKRSYEEIATADNGNMVRNQEPQAPPQQTPQVAATQPIVDEEALNGQLEDVGANDDNKDQDNATKAYIDAMGGPGDVPGERALGSATDQNWWNLTVLTSSDNPPLLHDINRAPLDWKTLFTDGTSRRQTTFIAQQEMNWLDHWSLRPEVQEALDNELKKFLAWLQQRHPDDFSRHIERAGGGCQDLTPMASHPLIWNRELCVEYLDERLCVPGNGLRVPRNVDILRSNLFTVLCTSSDNPFRVSTSVEALLVAFDEEFSLCANYPKGHGDP